VFETVVVWEERVDGNAAIRYSPWKEHQLDRSYSLSHSLFSIQLSNDPLPFTSPFFRINVSSLVEPTRIMDISSFGIVVKKVHDIKGYDSTLYKSKRIWVPTHDVLIPVTLVYKQGISFPAPMVLYGYGSYETSIDLSVSASRISLLDRGVVYAIAHVRGGGECGREWYEKGKCHDKENTFYDYVAVAIYLIQKGWTTSNQLVGRGSSAGGMLMGAVMNVAPTLFKAMVAEVPFVDVLTTMLDKSLPLSISECEEWGNPEDEHTYSYIKRYSPYDNVKPIRYPHLYVTGGIHDTRVGFWEPLKWGLAIRDAHPKNEAYITINGTGHTGATQKKSQWEEEAEIITFILSETDPKKYEK